MNPANFGGFSRFIHAEAARLDDQPVKVHEPYQVLGLVEEDLLDALLE